MLEFDNKQKWLFTAEASASIAISAEAAAAVMLHHIFSIRYNTSQGLVNNTYVLRVHSKNTHTHIHVQE